MDFSFNLPPMSGTSPMINYRKDAKKAIKFTFMVAGELGTGKTTFVNCLLNRKIMSHAYEGSNMGDTKTLSFTLVRAMALPNTSALARNQFDPLSAHEEPGIAMTETNVEVVDDDNVRLNLNIIDTPGFGDNLDNSLCFAEIENYLKQQFDLVLAEETRIRRNPRFVDTRVHVLLYFITPTGHGLRELDIACMKKLARFVNIIPVVGRADTFTEAELRHFKKQIRVDIERFNVPVFQFDNFMDDYDEEEDSDLIEECKYLTRLQPFAIIASEQDFEIRDTLTGESRTIKARQYPWGLVDVNNTDYSDFSVLKSVILGSHLQDLKDLTHDFLYETYRTERLSTVTGNEDVDESSAAISKVDEANNMLANVPSMSNLAQLTEANDTSMKLDSHINDDSSQISSDSKKAKSMLIDESDTTADSPSKDTTSLKSSRSVISNTSPNLGHTGDSSFKRMSIAPQRHQLRQISETVPYVIRHERILERQHKLEEMEMASAKELSNRAALLEQKAAQLKAKEKLMLQKLEAYKNAAASAKSGDDDTSVHSRQTSVAELEATQTHESLENYTTIPKDETLTDLHSVVEQG